MGFKSSLSANRAIGVHMNLRAFSKSLSKSLSASRQKLRTKLRAAAIETLESRRMLDGMLDDANSTFPDSSVPEGSGVQFHLHFTNAWSNDYFSAAVNFPTGSPQSVNSDPSYDELDIYVDRTVDDNGAISADADTAVGATYGWPYRGHWELAEVYNVEPTATLDASGLVAQNAPFEVSLEDPSDPSSVDTTAGFRYSFATDPGNLASSYAAASASEIGQVTFTSSGAQVVYGRIFDKDDGYSDYSQTVTVQPAPSVTVTPVATTTTEGSFLTVNSSITDPTHSSFTYSWIVERNGIPVATSTQTNLIHQATDNATYVMHLSVTNEDGAIGTASSSTITVTNVAPSVAVLDAPATSAEAVSIALRGHKTDPGSDTHSYVWRVTKNSPTITYATATTNDFNFTPDDNGVYVVTFTATDDDGGSNSDSKTITVTNVNPTALLTNSTHASVTNYGSTITVSFSVPFDVSSADRAAGTPYRYYFDIDNNGSFEANNTTGIYTFVDNSGGYQAYNVHAQIRDKDGQISGAGRDYYSRVFVDDGSTHETNTYGIGMTGAEPDYNPTIWNATGPLEANNCYNYAVNFLTPDYRAQPGDWDAAGFVQDDLSGTLDNMKTEAAKDGLVYLGASASSTDLWNNTNLVGNYRRYYVVALVFDLWIGNETIPTQDSASADYHWYRLDSNGQWSNKPGDLSARNLDTDDLAILDPETAARDFSGDGGHNYDEWGGYFAVPIGTVVA